MFRPLYNPGNDIISAYLEGIGKKQNAIKLAQDKEEQERQHELEQERIHNEHDIAQKQIDLMSQANELKRLTTLQDVAEKYQQTGTAPPGVDVQSPTTTTPPDSSIPNPAGGNIPMQNMPISTTPGLGTDQQRITLPDAVGGGSSIIRNPVSAAQLAAQLEKIRTGPAAEQQTKIEQMRNQTAIMDRAAQDQTRIDVARMTTDSANNRAEVALRGQIYQANEAYKRAVDAATINAGRLTGAQKLDGQKTKDMLDSVNHVLDVMGPFKNGAGDRWGKYFTNSTFDEIGRNNPEAANLTGIGKMPAEVSDINAALTELDRTLAEKGADNKDVQKSLSRGASGMRSQTPNDAHNNLRALQFELQQQLLNLGSENRFSFNPNGFPSPTPPSNGNAPHIYVDKNGKEIGRSAQ